MLKIFSSGGSGKSLQTKFRRDFVKIYRGYECDCFMCSNDITYDKMKMNGIDENTDASFKLIHHFSQSLSFSSWKDVFEQLQVNWGLITAYDNFHPKNLSRNMEMLVDENQRIFQCATSLASYPCMRENDCFIQE